MNLVSFKFLTSWMECLFYIISQQRIVDITRKSVQRQAWMLKKIRNINRCIYQDDEVPVLTRYKHSLGYNSTEC